MAVFLNLLKRVIYEKAEDLYFGILYRKMNQEISKIDIRTLVKIGANTGEHRHDYIGKILRENYEVSGLMVEPQPVAFLQLRKNFAKHQAMKCVQMAVSDIKGTASFYCPDTIDGRLGMAGASSLQKDHASSIGKGKYLEYEVETITLKELLSENQIESQSIDLLQMDTEGYDVNIILSTDWNLVRPRNILFEVRNTESIRKSRGPRYKSALAHLKKAGYKEVCEVKNWDILLTRTSD